MSTRTLSRAPAARRSRIRSGLRRRRRRLGLVVGVGVLAALLATVVLPRLPDALRELTLPLHHEDIIRQQAAAKRLDPSLVAAVIYTESRFRDQTSHAGARGLMQITPATARFIARDSGGTAFTHEDLATPQINIAYGAYYLRYLIDHYGGNETLAVAAYNAGQTNVDRWVRAAGGPDSFDPAKDIPFPETRGYVHGVASHRDDYRHHYANELGY